MYRVQAWHIATMMEGTTSDGQPDVQLIYLRYTHIQYFRFAACCEATMQPLLVASRYGRSTAYVSMSADDTVMKCQSTKALHHIR